MHAVWLEELGKAFGHRPADLTEQNVQARIRGQILMALSNETGALVLSTGNNSELAVGYCTLYGDMAGGLAVIGDLPKMLVYRVARAVNRRAGRPVIRSGPSPRRPRPSCAPTRPTRTPCRTYEELDRILERYLLGSLTYAQITSPGEDPDTVRRVLTMVSRAEFKRRQAAPVLKVSPRAFGTGRRIPIARRLYEA